MNANQKSIDAIRKLRESWGISRKAVANATGISYSMYNAIERGERAVGMKTGTRLADFYGVTLDSIMGRTDIQSLNPDDPCVPAP